MSIYIYRQKEIAEGRETVDRVSDAAVIYICEYNIKKEIDIYIYIYIYIHIYIYIYIYI